MTCWDDVSLTFCCRQTDLVLMCGLSSTANWSVCIWDAVGGEHLSETYVKSELCNNFFRNLSVGVNEWLCDD